MRKNILSSLLLAGTLAVLSCSPKRVIVKVPENSTVEQIPDKNIDYIAKLKQKNLVFNTLSLKGKTLLNIDGNENSVTLNLRIQRDKKIWFSVTALGGALEAARGQITPDSIFVMNRLQRTILRKPMSYVHTFTNPQVNFAWLQAILVGNTINDLMLTQADIQLNEGVWQVKGNESGLVYRMLFNTLPKMQELTLNDAAAGQALKVNYQNFTQLAQGLIPAVLKINSVAGPKKIMADIEFSKLDIDIPLDFPFSVPRSYELIP